MLSGLLAQVPVTTPGRSLEVGQRLDSELVV